MEFFNDPVFWLCITGMVVGLAGSILPALPGVPLIFISAFVYAYLTGFEMIGGWTIAVLAVFALLALVADFIGTSYGARRFGASNWGTAGGAIGGIVGALVGFLLLGIGALFGLILGSIGGVFLGEYMRRQRQGRNDRRPSQPSPTSSTTDPDAASSSGLPRQTETDDWRRVSRAAGGVLVGYAISAVAQVLLGIASVVVFLIALFN